MKKILLLILCIFNLLIFQPLAMAESSHVKFVQVSDVHYVPNDEYLQEKIKALVNNINNLKNVDFVVFTGDNVDFASSDYLREFLTKIEEIRVPCYFVIGNQDVSEFDGLSKEKYMQIVHSRYKMNPANSNYVFKKNGIVFAVVDGARQTIPSANGYYRKQTLEWLDRVLSENIENLVVILQHFPIYAPNLKRPLQTYKADEYLTLLDSHENVSAVISGHVYANQELMRKEVYHIITPAFMSEPHYYRIIDITVGKNLLPMVFTDLQTIDVVEE